MLDLPPPFDGRAVAAAPLPAAVAAARAGCEAGLLLHRPSETELDAALVLAPEVPLTEAAAMLLVTGNGLADALGALAPPELALHLEWPGGLRLEGGRCGGLRAVAPPVTPDAVPGWLVIGLNVPVDRQLGDEPGAHAGDTDLRSEGVALPPEAVLAAWARHSLSWIARWEDEGMAPVHRDWLARAWRGGESLTVALPGGVRSGRFRGLDAGGGLLLEDASGVASIPLAAAVEPAC